MSLEIRPEHGAVLGVLLGGVVTHHIFMALKVGKARKKYGVTYPDLYAPAGHKDAHAFNCVQRAHQNSLENLPTFYALLLTSGLKYPISASIAGAVYLLGRFFYFKGYSTGDPKARTRGAFMYFGTLGMLGMVARWSVELLSPALGL